MHHTHCSNRCMCHVHGQQMYLDNPAGNNAGELGTGIASALLEAFT